MKGSRIEKYGLARLEVTQPSHTPAHNLTATVASFRTWRSSQPHVARGPDWATIMLSRKHGREYLDKIKYDQRRGLRIMLRLEPIFNRSQPRKISYFAPASMGKPIANATLTASPNSALAASDSTIFEVSEIGG